jgi:uncharacterized repeat protein (TIGR03803 family)
VGQQWQNIAEVMRSRQSPTERRLASHTAVVRLALATCIAVLSSRDAHTQVQVEVLHSFNYQIEGSPTSGLIEGRDGSFYGTSGPLGGGSYGSVFKISPDGTLTVLHRFTGLDGSQPSAGLVQGTDGKFYGSAGGGGAFDLGTIFRVSSDGEFAVLHHFDGSDGAGPGALIQGRDGQFYGPAGGGGLFGFGTAFRMSPPGELTVLHHFAGGPGDGAYPSAALVEAADGDFYGTTSRGGARGDAGTVFRLTREGSVTVLRSLYANDGDYNFLGVDGIIEGRDGNLYGTVRCCTKPVLSGSGSEAFRITPFGVYTTLHVFNHLTEGVPFGPLLHASDGTLYGIDRVQYPPGAQRSSVFQIAPDGRFVTTYVFDESSQGSYDLDYPRASLIEGRDHNLYGTTIFGGALGGVPRSGCASPPFNRASCSRSLQAAA